MSAGLARCAVPTSIHCDHLIQAIDGAQSDLEVNSQSQSKRNHLYGFLAIYSVQQRSLWFPRKCIQEVRYRVLAARLRNYTSNSPRKLCCSRHANVSYALFTVVQWLNRAYKAWNRYVVIVEMAKSLIDVNFPRFPYTKRRRVRLTRNWCRRSGCSRCDDRDPLGTQSSAGRWSAIYIPSHLSRLITSIFRNTSNWEVEWVDNNERFDTSSCWQTYRPSKFKFKFWIESTCSTSIFREGQVAS